MTGYRHIISKTNNAQQNAFHYALAKTIGTISSSNEYLRKMGLLHRSLVSDLEELKRERSKAKSYDDLYVMDGQSIVDQLMDDREKLLESSIEKLDAEKEKIEKSLVESDKVIEKIEEKLYEIGAPILDCVTTVKTFNGDHRRAFTDDNAYLDLQAMEDALNSILKNHFPEGHYAIVPVHEFGDKKPSVQYSEIDEIFSIAFNKRDLDKFQGFMEEFTDTLMRERKAALERSFFSDSLEYKGFFLSINHPDGCEKFIDSYVKSLSESEMRTAFDKAADGMIHEVGFTIGDGTSNVMNDFIALRSIDKILDQTCRKPFLQVPCGFRVNELKEKFRDIQSSMWFSSRKEKALAEMELSALCFFKENPDLAEKGDIVFKAMVNQDKADKKVELSSDNAPSL
ncbi:hypothetical protein [Vibrio parahaemolyticus]|uniref:hypothetical protein n=1 Tax=Vibrio parahaemolyticus TaxID=670 RepID=UPI00226A45CD|nr:hypothetical protein [Vibrio parahaemolyticus]MCX8796125.1 hypothetical protein [Vibrio parahaemolyticus]